MRWGERGEDGKGVGGVGRGGARGEGGGMGIATRCPLRAPKGVEPVLYYIMLYYYFFLSNVLLVDPHAAPRVPRGRRTDWPAAPAAGPNKDVNNLDSRY